MTLNDLLLPGITLAALAVFYYRSGWGKNVTAIQAAKALDPAALQAGQEGRLTGTVEVDGAGGIAGPISDAVYATVVATARTTVGEMEKIHAKEEARAPFFLRVGDQRVRIDPADAEISVKLSERSSTSIFDGANEKERAMLERHGLAPKDSMGLNITWLFYEQGIKAGATLTAAGRLEAGQAGQAGLSLVAPPGGRLRLMDA